MAEDHRTFSDFMRESREALEPYAAAIGQLSIQWAAMERMAAMLCAAMLNIEGNDDRSHAMIDCIDFRDQLSMIKVGAAAGADKDWAELVIGSIDYIDSVLRLRRNRYIHDRWDWSFLSGVARIDHTPKALRAPGSGERTWRRHAIEHEPVTAITDTTDAVFEEHVVLAELLSICRGRTTQTLQGLRAKLPPRLLQVPPQGTPHQTDSIW